MRVIIRKKYSTVEANLMAYDKGSLVINAGQTYKEIDTADVLSVTQINGEPVNGLEL